MTGKKRYSRLANGGGSDLAGTLQPEKKPTFIWPAMFFSGFKLQPEKLRPEKKGTVVWPMEAAQIWRERYDLKKKCTVVWTAMFFSGFKLQPEKNSTGKKRYSRLAVSWKQEKITSGKKVQSSGCWLEDKTQNTTTFFSWSQNNPPENNVVPVPAKSQIMCCP
jgi:hypothetical protein